MPDGDEPRRNSVSVARTFIEGYNERRLEQMVGVASATIVLRPSRALGGGEYHGADGLRGWWAGVGQRHAWYEIAIDQAGILERRYHDRRSSDRAPVSEAGARSARGADRRRLTADKVVMFGQLRLDGEVLAPWASLLTVYDGLVLDSCSYLSPRSLLHDVGVADDTETSFFE